MPLGAYSDGEEIQLTPRGRHVIEEGEQVPQQQPAPAPLRVAMALRTVGSLVVEQTERSRTRRRSISSSSRSSSHEEAAAAMARSDASWDLDVASSLEGSEVDSKHAGASSTMDSSSWEPGQAMRHLAVVQQQQQQQQHALQRRRLRKRWGSAQHPKDNTESSSSDSRPAAPAHAAGLLSESVEPGEVTAPEQRLTAAMPGDVGDASSSFSASADSADARFVAAAARLAQRHQLEPGETLAPS